MTALPTLLRSRPDADTVPVLPATPPAPPSAAPHLRRRPLLDGLRGLMVAVTVAYHLENGSWLHGGWLGVSGFFVLSGYLITGLLLVEQQREGRVALLRFYARRARRLAPTLLAVVAATVVAVRLTGAAPDQARMRGDAWATLGYVANWRFVETDQSYFAAFTPSPLRHTWSLAIEEQFYLVWPWLLVLLVAVVGHRRLPVLLAAGAAASAWWASHLAGTGAPLTRVYDGTDTRAQELLVGACAAAVAMRLGPPSAEPGGAARRRRQATAVGIVGLGVFAVATVVLRPSSATTYTRGLLLLVAVAIGGVVLSCAVADRGPLGRILGAPALRALGARSYSLYLVHWPVFVILDAPRVDWSPWVLDGARLVVALGVAEVVHRAVELPFHQGRVHLRHPGRTLAAATVAVAVVVALATWTPAQGGGARSVEAPMSVEPSVVTAPPTSAAGPRIPKVVILGDSQAYALLRRPPADATLQVAGSHHGGCDVVGEVIAVGDVPLEAAEGCPAWPEEWGRALEGGADAVVVTLGLRQVFDPMVDGERLAVGSPAWEEVYRDAVDRAVAVIRASTGAPILWFDVPCYRWYMTAGEERDATRLRTVNMVLADQLARHHGITVAPYAAQVCHGPDGTESIDEMRPDGVHLDDAATDQVWSWIRGQVALDAPPG